VLRDKLGFGVYNVHTGFDPANTEQLAALLKTHDVHVDPVEVLTLEGFCKLRRELDAQPSGFSIAVFVASSRLRKSAPSRARTSAWVLRPMRPGLPRSVSTAI
jgi:exoribonuclease II